MVAQTIAVTASVGAAADGPADGVVLADPTSADGIAGCYPFAVCALPDGTGAGAERNVGRL